MASRTQRNSGAPWVLTALVMLTGGVVVFYGAAMLKDKQAQIDGAEHSRAEALQNVTQLELQVTALTRTLSQVAKERDEAAAKVATLQAALDSQKPAPEKQPAPRPALSK